MTTTAATPARVVVYVRLSSYRGDADPSTSPARQRESCEAYALAKGWEVVEVVEDLNVSGSDKGLRLDRPGLSRVRAALPDVDVVIFAKLDRLARNVVDFRAFAEEADAHGVALVSVAESLDLTTPSGRFVATILAAFAEMEAATIRTRTVEGIAKTVELRRWRGGRPPYGYRTAPHPSGSGRTLEIDPAEAEVVREIVGRLLGGASLFSEVKRLQEAGIHPRQGTEPRLDANGKQKPPRKFSISTLRAMVTGPHLLGYMRHQGELVRDAEGAVEVVFPPLISEADHLALTRMYPPKGTNAKSTTRRKSARLLSGLVRCRCCGHKMRVSSNAQGPRYVCNSISDGRGCAQPSSISSVPLEDYVEKMFLDAVGSFEVVRVEIVEAGGAEAAAIEAAIRHTASELAEPGADVLALASKMQDLHRRREALRAAPAVEHRAVPTGKTFREEWESADLVGRQRLLADRLDYVEIARGRPGVKGIQKDRVRPAWHGEYTPSF